MARLAFFGTPEFSVPAFIKTYQFCQQNGHELVMAVTQPDKEQGRGQKLLPPPVKIKAVELGIPVLQPCSLKKSSEEGELFFQQFCAAKIDLVIVVAYGKIIPTRFLSVPACGFVNIHGSLLPRYRGAAPIQRALLEGEAEAGVCLMDVVAKMDEGDVFAQAKTPIIASDTSLTLFRRLSRLGAHLLYRNLDSLLKKNVTRVVQEEDKATYAAMLSKDEGLLSFTKSGARLAREARAFDPWPHSWAYIHTKRVKFFDSFFISTNAQEARVPGTIVALEPFLGIRTIDGIVYYQRIQVEGKKVLPVSEALRGFLVNVGDRIEGTQK